MDTLAASHIKNIAFLGNYPPRACGIATFTAHVREAVATRFPYLRLPVVAINDTSTGYTYPREVKIQIPARELAGYRRAADALNLMDVDVLSVQHEFGIFGGPAGSFLLELLKELRIPVVTTLHTILQHPDDRQRKVMAGLEKYSERFVVMAERGVEFLRDIYGIPEERIDVIPHGIPDVPFADPDPHKELFGVEGRHVLLTFGLLSPNKGIENAIRALPAITAEFPETVYIVLGATHPDLLRHDGESYRISLEHLAKKKGVQRNVMFLNQYVDETELADFIAAADLYITPYRNEAQITSGTLAQSFGSGKAVISTPYWHAEELLADGRGVLVPFANPDAIAEAALDLLRHPEKREAMRKAAYQAGRVMIWHSVAGMYAGSFQRAQNAYQNHVEQVDKNKRERVLPPWNFGHLQCLSDRIGIFQHAMFAIPDYNHGYCTDDNARALLLTALLEELGENVEGESKLVGAYGGFLENALHNGRFRNFMGFDRQWREEVGSQDSHGRALWALGTYVAKSQRESLRSWATTLFERALPAVETFTAPRSMVFSLLGMRDYASRIGNTEEVLRLGNRCLKHLMSLYATNQSDDWCWFEDIVTYDNPKIPHALLAAGSWLGRSDAIALGLRSLRWLAESQTGDDGVFRPVGSSGFWKRGEQPARFDQQPLEAHAMVSAALEAYRYTEDPYWRDEAQRAFEWFLGHNDLAEPLYDPQTGGCRDGLHPGWVNQNQGAESTLAYLLARAELQTA